MSNSDLNNTGLGRLYHYPQYRNAVLLATILGIIAYLIFIANFPIDSHYPRLPWIDPFGLFARGNYFTPAIASLFYNANVPVLTPILSILFLAASGAVTCLLFDKSPSGRHVFFCAAFMVTFPFQLTVFYYSFSSHVFSSGQLLAVLSVYASFSQSRFRHPLAGILAFLAMATYQPAVSIIATLLLLKSASIISADTERDLKGLASKIGLPCISLASGTIVYAISTYFASGESYVLETKNNINEILTESVPVFTAGFQHLLYTQPELLATVKYTLLLVVFGAGFSVLATNQSVARKCVTLLLIIGGVIATKSLFFISSSEQYFEYRYNYSLGYFYLVAFIFCWQLVRHLNFKFLRVIFVALMFFSVFRFMQADLVRQHVLLRGVQHDLALMNRIAMRIEALPGLDREKEYKLYIWGGLPEFRTEAFQFGGHKADGPTYDIPGSIHLDQSTPAPWNAESAMRLLGSPVEFQPLLPTRKETRKKIRDVLRNGTYETWPHESAVFIHDDTIIVFMDRTPDLK